MPIGGDISPFKCEFCKEFMLYSEYMGSDGPDHSDLGLICENEDCSENPVLQPEELQDLYIPSEEVE